MKIIIIGGRGTAIVVADQMIDAHERYDCVEMEFVIDMLRGCRT